MQEGGEPPADQETVEISREELRALAEAVFFLSFFLDGSSRVKNCLGLSGLFLSFFLSFFLHKPSQGFWFRV